MAGYLIKETTCEERKQIVEEALGNLSASCDGCMAGLADIGEKTFRQKLCLNYT